MSRIKTWNVARHFAGVADSSGDAPVICWTYHKVLILTITSSHW